MIQYTLANILILICTQGWAVFQLNIFEIYIWSLSFLKRKTLYFVIEINFAEFEVF